MEKTTTNTTEVAKTEAKKYIPFWAVPKDAEGLTGFISFYKAGGETFKTHGTFKTEEEALNAAVATRGDTIKMMDKRDKRLKEFYHKWRHPRDGKKRGKAQRRKASRGLGKNAKAKTEKTK